MKNKIRAYVIVCFVLSTALFTITAAEQIFRDEVEADMTPPRVSYEKYQNELAKLLEPARPHVFNLGNLNYVLFPLGAITFGIVLIFFIRQIQRNLIREIDDKTETEIAVDRVKNEQTALASVETAAESRNFREALRYLYLSAILHLQERDILPHDKSLTNREYLHQVQADIELQATLAPAITVFDEVWYGHKHCDAETIAHYRELLQKIYNNPIKS